MNFNFSVRVNYYYSMRGDAVVIREVRGGEETVINEKSLRLAIANVKGSRGDYVTEEGWRRAVERVEGALAFMLASREKEAPVE